MQDVILRLADVPIARMFVLAGIVFLMIAVLGKVEGKIDPGQVGRIGASMLGIVLMVIGVAMQYAEMHEVRQERLSVLQQTVAAAITPGAMAPGAAKASEVQAAAAMDRPSIRIISGTYGRGCNGKAGNATALLAKACDGKPGCDYAVEPVTIENAPANCVKDLAAEWKCGTAGTVYSATLPADAVGKNEKLHVACGG
jgi:hypothetical protein